MEGIRIKNLLRVYFEQADQRIELFHTWIALIGFDILQGSIVHIQENGKLFLGYASIITGLFYCITQRSL